MGRQAAARVDRSDVDPVLPAAIVTGPASGIGAAFSRRLAKDGVPLLLVDRQAAALKEMRQELGVQADGRIRSVAADLARPEGLALVEAAIGDLREVGLLVNSAGFGNGGEAFSGWDLQRQMDMVRVHDIAAMHLSYAVLPRMMERGSGAIINVCSLGAWLTIAGNVTYSASKAFLITFSQGLQREVREDGIFPGHLNRFLGMLAQNPLVSRPLLGLFSRRARASAVPVTQPPSAARSRKRSRAPRRGDPAPASVSA